MEMERKFLHPKIDPVSVQDDIQFRQFVHTFKDASELNSDKSDHPKNILNMWCHFNLGFIRLNRNISSYGFEC